MENSEKSLAIYVHIYDKRCVSFGPVGPRKNGFGGFFSWKTIFRNVSEEEINVVGPLHNLGTITGVKPVLIYKINNFEPPKAAGQFWHIFVIYVIRLIKNPICHMKGSPKKPY